MALAYRRNMYNVFSGTIFFFEPRLWAEEGKYYAHAYRYSQTPLWYKGLLNVFPEQGYFAFWSNLASTIAANMVSVEQAPLVMTFMALIIQLLPLAIIIWSRATFWSSPLRRLLGLLICLLMPLSGEIWLNTINSQFYMSLVVTLVLMEPLEDSLLRKWVYRLLLVLGGLTGLPSAALAPVYVVLAWLTKERERLVQAILLGLCALLQIGLLVSLSDELVNRRLADGRLYLVIFVIWTQSLGLVVGSLTWTAKWASWILMVYEQGGLVFLAVWVRLLLVTLLVFFWLAVHLSIRERVIFLCSYIVILLVSYVGSLGNKLDLIVPGNGQRYFWVPNVILGFVLMANVFQDRSGKLHKRLCTVLLVVVLVLGANSYRTTLLANSEWPQWRTEVALWRANPDYRLKIWPLGWEISLKKERIEGGLEMPPGVPDEHKDIIKERKDRRRASNRTQPTRAVRFQYRCV